jgi:zinc D-Ala-D-Ala carboxypeptidase
MRLYDIDSKFTSDEFKCPCDCEFGAVPEDIDPNLINRLNMMRILYGSPMLVTSGARCIDYNKEIGGVPSSAHLPHYSTLQCRAVDIAVSNGSNRAMLLDLANRVGFKRIGIADTFIHLDVAWDLPTPNTFIY